jgi:hypothetical protein
VPLNGKEDSLLVNYVSLEIKEEGKRASSYKSSWITDQEITDENVVAAVECARARWKIENEHNNVLKNRGYNLKHNFGHGKNYLSENFFILNLIAFLHHSLLELLDEIYNNAKKTFSSRKSFFEALRVCLRYELFASWNAFIMYVYKGKDHLLADNTS